ncbi:MAG: GNAT family N-acetyltransferase [Xylophilus ampelinus]
MHKLVSDRIILIDPGSVQISELVRFRRSNRDHLQPWEPLRNEFYSEQGVEHQLRELSTQVSSCAAMHWFLQLKDDDTVVGTCSFNNIMMGPFQACNLGFSLDHQHQRKGFMHEALTFAIEHAFAAKATHRIMANYRPENIRSENLLIKLGFVREGYARSYLKINGKWEDHILTSLIRDI